jgi:hypothetical protein
MVTWGAVPAPGSSWSSLPRPAHPELCSVTYHSKTSRAVAHVLRHASSITFSGGEGYTTDRIIDELLAATPAHEQRLTQDARLQKVLGS